MSRIRNAWRALMGAEPEVREVVKEVVKTETVLGSAEEATIYRVVEEEKVPEICAGYVYVPGYTLLKPVADYTTCEQAHAEHPGKKVQAVKVYRVGRVYVTSLSVTKLDVKKPKRAKGAK